MSGTDAGGVPLSGSVKRKASPHSGRFWAQMRPPCALDHAATDDEAEAAPRHPRRVSLVNFSNTFLPLRPASQVPRSATSHGDRLIGRGSR